MFESINGFLKQIASGAQFVRIKEFRRTQAVPDIILAHTGHQAFVDIFVRQLNHAATVLTQAAGDFFRGFASNFVIVQTEPDFVEAVQVVILVLNPLLLGALPATERHRQRAG